MHSQEEKHSFTLLRSQGWSLAKIAAHLKIPKATIWHWDHEDNQTLQLLKAFRFEQLQETFVPTYEEELQQLSEYLARIRKALANHDFSSMKPEYLLQMDLQISSRLTKFRTNLGLHSIPETEPVSIPGCISRIETPYTGKEPEDDPTVCGEETSSSPSETSKNGTFRDEIPPGSKRDDSAATPSDNKNGTAVPFSELLDLLKNANGNSTRNAAVVTRTPRASSNSAPSTSPSKNGTFRYENTPGSKRDASAAITCDDKNGTAVPFSTPNLVHSSNGKHDPNDDPQGDNPAANHSPSGHASEDPCCVP